MKFLFKPKQLALSLAALCSSFSLHAAHLSDVYQQAVQTSPTLQEAQAARDQAYANVGVSRASLLPQLNADLSTTKTFSRDTADTRNTTGQDSIDTVAF